MNYELLKVTSLTLLMGTCGISIVLAMRSGESIHLPFERVIMAYLLISFYLPTLTALNELGLELSKFISTLGDTTGIAKFMASALYSAATDTSSSTKFAPTPNIPNFFAQILRTGVWGAAASFTELVYILAAFILEAGRDLLWQALLVFFPVGAAFLPVAPRVPTSMILTGLELILWQPVLSVINISAGKIAREYSQRVDSYGFRVLALEIVSISLTFGIPMLTSRIVSGNLTSGIIDPWKTVVALGKKFSTKSSLSSGSSGSSPSSSSSNKKEPRRRTKALILIPFSACLWGLNAEARDTLFLRKGFLKKVECKGRLYASGVGDDAIVDLEVLPPNLGCGVILKPLAAGTTNLILETSTGSVEKMISITGGKKQVAK